MVTKHDIFCVVETKLDAHDIIVNAMTFTVIKGNKQSVENLGASAFKLKMRSQKTFL